MMFLDSPSHLPLSPFAARAVLCVGLFSGPFCKAHLQNKVCKEGLLQDPFKPVPFSRPTSWAALSQDFFGETSAAGSWWRALLALLPSPLRHRPAIISRCFWCRLGLCPEALLPISSAACCLSSRVVTKQI